jgi:hypothetical protein
MQRGCRAIYIPVVTLQPDGDLHQPAEVGVAQI